MHNFQRILIPLVLKFQMPMNLPFIVLLTHARRNRDIRRPGVFSKYPSFVKGLVGPRVAKGFVVQDLRATCSLGFCSLKFQDHFLLAEQPYAMYIITLSFILLIFGMGIIIVSSESLIKIQSDDTDVVFSLTLCEVEYSPRDYRYCYYAVFFCMGTVSYKIVLSLT